MELGKITSLLFISMSLVVWAKVVVVIVLRLVGSIIYFLVWSCPPSSHLITHRKTIDIREQYPIPISDSLEICRQLGIKHPQVSGKLKVVTTDFLFDFNSQKQLALSVKYIDELADPRVMDKLQIEKSYWELC